MPFSERVRLWTLKGVIVMAVAAVSYTLVWAPLAAWLAGGIHG